MGAAPAGTPWDVYREIHKAMRYALATVTTRAGATEAAHPAEVQALVDEWRDVRMVLMGHHAHEDDFCDHLVERHAPELRDELEAAHHEADAAIERIDATVDTLVDMPDERRWAAIRELHLDLADFAATYARHLRFEEDRVMPALNAALSDAELEAVTAQIRGSVPPPEMCVFIRYMVPSMNFAERLDMLGGMHQGAPPEIFEMFRAAAEAALTTDEYRAVAVAAGFA